MKNLLSLFICLSLITFSSCGDDDKENGKVKLTAKFTYIHNGETKPSAATEMVIFKINESTESWTYNKANNYYTKKDGSVVYPIYTFRADNNGIIEQYIEDNLSYLYVYEPSIDPNVWGIDNFTTNGKPVLIEKSHGLSNQ